MLLLSSLAKDQETSGRILLIAGRASADTGRQGLVWRHRRRALLAAVSTLRWPTQQAAPGDFSTRNVQVSSKLSLLILANRVTSRTLKAL